MLFIFHPIDNQLETVYPNQQQEFMFFGKVITKNTPFVFSSQNVDENVGDVICISNLALAPNSSNDNTALVVKKQNQQYILANLNKRQPHISVNFYIEIEQYVQFIVKGQGAVHVIGFFEPEPKFNHLDEVQLLHKHEHDEAIHNHHHQQVKQSEKQIDLKKGQRLTLQDLKPKGNIVDTQQDQSDEQLAQDIDLDQQADSQSESEIQEDDEKSPLKGLEDIDDDIGGQIQNKEAHKLNNGKDKDNKKMGKPKEKSKQVNPESGEKKGKNKEYEKGKEKVNVVEQERRQKNEKKKKNKKGKNI